MILTPTSLAASLAKWSGVRPQGAHENLRKPEISQKCTKLICMGTLNFQFVLRLSRLTCQETPCNSSRSRGSGHFRPWHRQLRDFAAAAGRTFRHPGRRHCGAPSGLGHKRRSHLNCTTGCQDTKRKHGRLLHCYTAPQKKQQQTSSFAERRQHQPALLATHQAIFALLLFDSTVSARPNLFFFSTDLPSSAVMSWPWQDQGRMVYGQKTPKNIPSA